jgi:hypothetical protein
MAIYIPSSLEDLAQPRWAPISGLSTCVGGGSGGVTPATVVAAATTQVTSYCYQPIAAPSERIRLVFPLIVGSGTSGEALLGNDVTVSAALEHVGTGEIVPCAFGGAASILAPNGTTHVIADDIAMSVAKGDAVRVRVCFTVGNSAHKIPGAIRTLSGAASEGAEARYAALVEGAMSGDQTLTAAAGLTKSGVFNGYAPIVLGFGTHPAAFYGGDSLSNGSEDWAIRQGGGGGPVWRALTGHARTRTYDPTIAPWCGLVDVSRSGEGVYHILGTGGFDKRAAILAACQPSDRIEIYNYGTNDTNNVALTNAQIMANQVAFCLERYLAGGSRIIWETLSARSTSTDGWKTLANQTAYNPTARRELIDWMLDGGFLHDCLAAGIPPGVIQVWDQTRLVRCDKSGSTKVVDPRGPLFLPDLEVVRTGTLTGVTSSSQFADTNSIPAVGSLRGLTLRFTSGPRINETRPIRYTNAAGTFFTGGFSGAPAVGDTYEVVRSYTNDGTHNTPDSSMLQAQTFDPNWITEL